MSTYITTPEVVLTIQIISTLGFIFLSIYTMYSYYKIKNITLLYISLAFAVIAISIILEITVIPLLEINVTDTEIYEAIFEGIQFLAAFLFFYGLRLIKSKKEGE